MNSVMQHEVAREAASYGWNRKGPISLTRWLRVLDSEARHAILVEAAYAAEYAEPRSTD